MGLAKYVALASIGLLPLSAAAGDYTPVTSDRMNAAPASDWLMPKGNYEGWMYSELSQIDTSNVKKLEKVWSFATNVDSGHEAPAVVNDGVMFVTTPYNQVIALEAASGDLLWRYKHDLPPDLSVMHNTNRGVALWEDKVYTSTLEGSVVALDAETGEKLWETMVGDWKVGAYITSAPIAVEGKILVGPSGGEYGVRGFLQALDADTGEKVWKTYSVPGPGQAGHDTWPQEGKWKDAWKHGGGSMWMPGNYDPDTGTLYWGVGNGSPWFGDQRPGDNLYLASVLAMDVGTGKIVGHYQYHWNDSWDWAAMNAPFLIDYEKNGETVKGLISPQRNGYMYWLTRDQQGGISYDYATNFVPQNVFKRLDPETGRPTYDMDRKPGTGKEATYCPSLWGGKDWPYAAFSPKTRLMYVPANDNHCTTMEGKVEELVPGQFWMGISVTDFLEGFSVDKDADNYGEIQAWDVDTQTKVWTKTFPKSFTFGSVLATGGNLIFTGGTNDRKFRAYDARTGDLLWETKTSSGIISPPSSFSVDGKQYIAVVSGWGVDAALTNGLLADQIGLGSDREPVPQGGAIHVYALPD